MAYNPVETYLLEAEDLLAHIEEAALALESRGPEPELVHQLFRAFHTIKGAGAMVGFTRAFPGGDPGGGAGRGAGGARGMREMKEAGAYNIAQDETTSVVFGMPAEAIKEGVVNRVLPLGRIAGELIRVCR